MKIPLERLVKRTNYRPRVTDINFGRSVHYWLQYGRGGGGEVRILLLAIKHTNYWARIATGRKELPAGYI
jgi:hypothetical protein